MPERFDRKKRSEIMSHVHGANTAPEKFVCGLLEEMGYTFFHQPNDLPGKPDILLPEHNAVMFVNGCFWHGCPVCRHAQIRPKENAEFWNKKLDRTLERDKENYAKLEQLGYRVIVIWECEINKKKTDTLKARIIDSLK